MPEHIAGPFPPVQYGLVRRFMLYPDDRLKFLDVDHQQFKRPNGAIQRRDALSSPIVANF